MEHEVLVRELPEMENWPLVKRLKLAKKRRKDQLRKWREREDADDDEVHYEEAVVGRRVSFEPSVALLESAARNDTAAVVTLLEAGVDPDQCNSDGLTALHQCCIDNCPELAAVLLSHGADISARDVESWTPLHAASRCGNLELVKLLISQGADVIAINSDGQMPHEIAETSSVLFELQTALEEKGIADEKLEELRNALPNRMLKDVEDCIKKNFEVTVPDDNGATILHIAAASGYYQVAELLLQHGAEVNAQDDDGWTPLHAASCWGQYEIIELLAEHDADLEMRTNDHETPVMLAGDQNITLLLHDLRTRQLERDMQRKSRPRSRTYSSSSRGHSVRRNSVRMKSSFSKRDAMEEGRQLMGDTQNGDSESGIAVGVGSESDPSVFSSDSDSPVRRQTGIASEIPNLEDEDEDENNKPAESGTAEKQGSAILPSSGQNILESTSQERSTTFSRRKVQRSTNDCCAIL